MTKIEKIRGWIKEKAGVSPIIAIILMVAITVVLAATIYVWVSGFAGGGGGSNVALTLKQVSHIQDGNAFDATEKYLNFTVQSVQGNPGWEDLKVTVGGTTVWDGSVGSSSIKYGFKVLQGSTEVINSTKATGAVLAGQTVSLDTSTNSIPVGTTLTIIDINSGSTILSLDVTY